MQSPHPSPDAIDAALRKRLPSELHSLLAPLTDLLTDILAGRVVQDEAEARLSTIAVGNIEGSKGISIGPGASSIVLEIGGITINFSEGWQRRPSTAPFMAADRPADFVPRPDEFERIVAHVLSGGSGSVAISAALRGAGGFGKTTLATAVCHDQRVRDAFPDGVIWVTLGEKPGPADLVSKAADLIERLTGSRPGYSSLEAAASALAETLGEHKLLLVIDDVWDKAHLQPFLQGGPHTVRLITTRNRDTLPSTVQPVDVDAMRPTEAVELLAAGLPHHEPYLPTLRTLATYLGEWPLLLKIVNGVLREQVGAGASLAAALTYVREGLDEEGITVFDTETAEGRSHAVTRTLAVSLNLLSTEEQQRFAELAIFPEDVAVPLATLQRYWDLSAFKAKQLCGRYAARSLLLAYDQTAGTIHLHDVVRAYLNVCHTTNLRDWHRALLAAHRPASGDWADQPEDEPYLWAYLVNHLEGAGDVDQLVTTVKNLRYLARKIVVTSTDAARADLVASLAYRPHDLQIQKLAHQIGRYNHLFARCQFYEACATTLVAHLWGSVDLAPLFRPLIARLSALALRPLHPFPDHTSPAHLRTLQSHTTWVNSGVFSPDGRLILSASDDHNLIIWDVASKKACYTLTGHTRRVSSGVFSPDGQLVLSTSDDNTLIIWDVANGQACHTLIGHMDKATSGMFSPDGQFVLSTSDDGSLIIWEVTNGKILHTLDHHNQSLKAGYRPWLYPTGQTARVNSGIFSPDGQFVLSAGSDCTLILWEVASGQVRHILRGHIGAVNSVMFSPDGQFALSASADDSLILWDVANGQVRHILKGHTGWVNSGVFSPDGKFALSASNDNTLILWEVSNGQIHHILKGHTGRVNNGVFSPDGKFALSASADGNNILWEVASGQAYHTLTGHTGEVNSGIFSPDGQLVLSASNDNTLILWEVISERSREQVRPTFIGHTARVNSVMFSPNGQLALSASADSSLILWDVANGQVRHILKGHTGCVNSGVFSPDGKFALSASNDNTLILWEVSNGQIHHILKGHTGTVRSGVFSSDGQLVLSEPFYDEAGIMWKVSSGQVHHTPQDHTRLIDSRNLSPDGQLELSASFDGIVYISEVASRQVRHTLKSHTGPITSLMFSPDGRLVLSASFDSTLNLWEVTSGKLRYALKGHTGRVDSGVFSPNGQSVLSVSHDGTLILWDVSHGHCLSKLYLENALTHCAFSPDGHAIVVGDEFGRVLFLRVFDDEQPS